MTERVIRLAGWTLLLAVLCAMGTVVTLAFATVEQSNAGGGAECRPFDVMLGRETDCEGWPTGRTMPMLLVVAAIAMWGVPERRGGNGAARVLGCLATTVVGIVMVVTVGGLDFSPRGTTMLLVWLTLLAGLVPLALLPFALRHDLALETDDERSDDERSDDGRSDDEDAATFP